MYSAPCTSAPVERIFSHGAFLCGRIGRQWVTVSECYVTWCCLSVTAKRNNEVTQVTKQLKSFTILLLLYTNKVWLLANLLICSTFYINCTGRPYCIYILSFFWLCVTCCQAKSLGLKGKVLVLVLKKRSWWQHWKNPTRRSHVKWFTHSHWMKCNGRLWWTMPAYFPLYRLLATIYALERHNPYNMPLPKWAISITDNKVSIPAREWH